MTSIPIYPCTNAQLDAALDFFDNDAMRQWLVLHDFATAAPGTAVRCGDADGALACVVIKVDETLDCWSVAGLASDLPKGKYHLDLRFADVEDAAQASEMLATGWELERYRYNKYKQKTTSSDAVLDYGNLSSVHAMGDAIYLVRDLINTPPSDMGPEELANAATELAETHGAAVTITQGEQLAREFPGVHTVGKASSRAPRLIDIRWGDASHPLVSLVGKGVCFDSGGLNIKGAGNMLLMKKDMGGAAYVLGLASLIMTHALPVQLRLIIPAVENSINGDAFRPSDVITMRSGLTVEVGNTDAEGRLILADALALACEETPDLLVDAATLTGAARVALGTDMPALFASRDDTAHGVINHAETLRDYVWRLPLHTPYTELLKSDVADINNISSGGYGGALTAALFLQHFVSADTDWMHLDMMAWNTTAKPGRPKGGEAQSLRAMFAYLKARYGS